MKKKSNTISHSSDRNGVHAILLILYMSTYNNMMNYF